MRSSAMLWLFAAAAVGAHGAEARLLDSRNASAALPSLSRKEILALKAQDVPVDAPAYYPYSSVEDFFENSGLDATKDLVNAGTTSCASTYPGSKAYTITDGVNERCFVAVIPTSVTGPAPVLYYSHGSGGSAAKCGAAPDLQGQTWIDIAVEYRFIFVCSEAVQKSAVNTVTGELLTGGVWSLPEVFNDTSGIHCDLSIDQPGGIEQAYYNNVLAEMDKYPDIFDTTRIFSHGCSQGSAMTMWQGVCNHNADPDRYPAIATHSTGLKIKGDGNVFPPCTQDPSTTWGECDECKYWPTIPSELESDMKACIFDNTADAQRNNPQFYRSSQALENAWNQLGYTAESHYSSGGHCVMHSFDTIATCLDDGTGHLLPNTPSCSDVAPDTPYTCEEHYQLGHCSKAYMVGYCCKTCFNCQSGCGK